MAGVAHAGTLLDDPQLRTKNGRAEAQHGRDY